MGKKERKPGSVSAHLLSSKLQLKPKLTLPELSHHLDFGHLWVFLSISWRRSLQAAESSEKKWSVDRPRTSAATRLPTRQNATRETGSNPWTTRAKMVGFPPVRNRMVCKLGVLPPTVLQIWTALCLLLGKAIFPHF